jgi:hypothetical protein
VRRYFFSAYTHAWPKPLVRAFWAQVAGSESLMTYVPAGSSMSRSTIQYAFGTPPWPVAVRVAFHEPTFEPSARSSLIVPPPELPFASFQWYVQISRMRRFSVSVHETLAAVAHRGVVAGEEDPLDRGGIGRRRLVDRHVDSTTGVGATVLHRHAR